MCFVNRKKLLRNMQLTTLVILIPFAELSSAESDFSTGKTRISVSAGTSTGFNGNYFQLGIGAGYYIRDGLELGLDTRSWMGGELKIHEVSPSVTYVFTQLESFKPYGGLLYRKTFIEGRDDRAAYGARGGFFLQQSQNLHLRAGIAAIRHQNCDLTIYSDCTEFYPEFSAGFYF